MCRRNSDSLWRKFTIQRVALLNGGLAPRQGGEGKWGRRVVEVVGGPVGKRRSIIATVPAHGDLSARARIYSLARASILCVRDPYYEYNGRGYAVLPGVDIRCHAC